MRTRLLAAACISLAIVTAPPVAHAQTSSPITEASVRAHMEFLASDALNGRGSGTRDEWIAAEYIASQMRRLGLEPLGDRRQGQLRSFVQQIELRTVETTAPPVLRAGSLRLTHGKEMLVQALGSISRVAGPLVIYKPGVAVTAGAVVVAPATLTADDRAAIAPASIVITPETDQIRQGWAQAPRLPTAAARAVELPAIAAPRATRLVVDTASHAALTAMRPGTTVDYNADTTWGATPSYTWNVLAQLTGSDAALRSNVILLSAHLDHVGMQPTATGDDKIFNGADDDASGSIAVLELAKAMAEGPKPKRSIIFAWFGSEERGGAGSNYFAETTSLAGVIANLQFEMIGRPDPKIPAKTLWLTGYERSNLGAELAKHGARLVADPYPDQNFFQRSDNYRFARKGIPAHTVSSFGLHKDYHQPTDEIGGIDFPHMVESIRSMLDPIRWLANDPWRPDWAPNGRPR